MDKALYELHKARPGIGGFHCSCCNPAFGKFRGPGSRQNRQAAKRALRRKNRQECRTAGINELHQQLVDAIHEHNDMVLDFGLGGSLLELNRLGGLRFVPVPEPTW